ncbi:MAG: hypothetical protein CAF45_006205 [Nitrospira sp. CG24E]|nr:MAG: hypothetical protein CAF45_006205 [Nitrospira sp. CG24E]
MKRSNALALIYRGVSPLSLWTVLIIACLTVCAGTNALADTVYPPNTVYGGPQNVPPLPRPGYLQPVIDPVFGAKITRISDESMGLSSAGYMQHHYSKDQPWNHDMTLIKLSNTRVILDAKTYQIFKRPSGKGESRWSTVDPSILFYTRGNQFRKWNVRSDEDVLLHTFSEGNISIGSNEGNISIGDRYVVVNVDTLVIVYDIANDIVVAKKDLGPIDWATMSQSGNYVVSRPGSSALGVVVYDRNLNLLRKIFDKGAHGDVGYDTAGNEVFVQMCPVQMSRLDNGQVTNLGISLCGHLSARNHLRLGWVSVGDGGANAEIFALRLDGMKTVERFAHMRTSGATYDAQAKGVFSPDGSKVMWNSDWGSGTVYAYVAEMPGNSGDTVPPVAPANLRVTGISQTGVDLSWNTSPDMTDTIGQPASAAILNH